MNLENQNNKKNQDHHASSYRDKGKEHPKIIYQQSRNLKKKKAYIVQENLLNLANLIQIPSHSLKLTFLNLKRRQRNRK
jgi:hypothetical protein